VRFARCFGDPVFDGSVLTQLAIDLEFFGGELRQHLVVAASVGLCDECAELSLAAFELAMFERVEGVFDLLGHGLSVGGGCVGIVCVLKCVGEESAAGLIGRGVERVRGCGGVGEGFEESCGREAVVPFGVLDELLGGEGAGGVVLGEDEGADEDTLGFAGGVLGVRADTFDTLRCGLFELLTERRGVDAEFLCSVGGKLVALDAVRHAANMRE